MRRFRYLLDPLFLACCCIYAGNRWLIEPHSDAAFFHNWCNDLLLIPCAMPPVLLFHRRLGLRFHDAAPTLSEVAAHVIGWTLLFEWIGPHLIDRATGDYLDAAAYLIGATLAFCWWNRHHLAGFVMRADEL